MEVVNFAALDSCLFLQALALLLQALADQRLRRQNPDQFAIFLCAMNGCKSAHHPLQSGQSKLNALSSRTDDRSTSCPVTVMPEPQCSFCCFSGRGPLAGTRCRPEFRHRQNIPKNIPCSNPQVTNSADFVQRMCTTMQWMGKFVARTARSLPGWQPVRGSRIVCELGRILDSSAKVFLLVQRTAFPIHQSPGRGHDARRQLPLSGVVSRLTLLRCSVWLPAIIRSALAQSRRLASSAASARRMSTSTIPVFLFVAGSRNSPS